AWRFLLGFPPGIAHLNRRILRARLDTILHGGGFVGLFDFLGHEHTSCRQNGCRRRELPKAIWYRFLPRNRGAAYWFGPDMPVHNAMPTLAKAALLAH